MLEWNEENSRRTRTTIAQTRVWVLIGVVSDYYTICTLVLQLGEKYKNAVNTLNFLYLYKKKFTGTGRRGGARADG